MLHTVKNGTEGATLTCHASLVNDENSDESLSLVEELENVYLTRRLEMVTEDMIATPLAVLLDMAQAFDTTCESEDYHFFLPEIREISWRIEMKVGQLKGVGEARLRKLASHMAAADILQQIKNSDLDVDVPLYGLLPGCRISPNVLVHLGHLCQRMNHVSPQFYYAEKKLNSKVEDGPFYKVYCKVGELIIRADSDSLILAKRLVARDMYETLSNKPYPEFEALSGSECIRLKLMKKLNITSSSGFFTDEILLEVREKKKQETIDKKSMNGDENDILSEKENDNKLEL